MSSTFVTSEFVEELLRHENNSVRKMNAEVAFKILGSGNHGNHGKGEGSKRAGEQLRGVEEKADVAVLAKLIGNKATGQMLGIGKTQVSQYSRGINGSNELDPALREEVENRLGILEEKAVGKVELFLDMIRAEETVHLAPDKLASSAEKMTNVLDKLRRRNEKAENRASQPIVHLHGPTMIKSETYITKEV